MKEKRKKKIVLLVLLIILLGLCITFTFTMNVKINGYTTKRDKLNASISIGIPPTVFVSNKNLNLIQNMGTQVSFEGRFKTYGNKDYYYKWMTYKNGIKQEESSCAKAENNYVDQRTMTIDSGINTGKWVIYSDSSCTIQSMVYFTLTYTGKGSISTKRTLTATFNKGAAASIGQTSASCETNFLTCSVTAPSITAPSGYEALGWSKNSDGTGTIYKPGNSILISSNTTYYPVLEKIDSSSNKTYTVTLNKNNAKAIGKTSVSCSTTTNDCSVQLPSITAPSGYEVVGWSSNKNATTAEYYANSYINISSNKTLYAIVKKISSSNSPSYAPKKITIKLNKNTASKIGKSSVSCTTSNGSCSVTLPSITAKSGYEVVGWAENPEATTATYKENEKITVSESKTLYAVTKQKPSITMTKYSDTFKAGTGPTYYGALNIKVTPATDTYTVTSSNENAMAIYNDVMYAVAPGKATITAKSSSGASVSYTYTVTGTDVTKDTSKLKKGIMQSYTIGNTNVYVEKGCSTSFANTLKNDIKETPANIRDATRAVYAMTSSTYDDVTGEGSVGLTHANGLTNVIDIDCGYKSNDVWGHELGHAVDYRFTKLSGKNMFSSRSELVSLYNKYNNSGNKNLRTDKFASSGEFWADIFNYYFRTYISKTTTKQNSEYKGLTYPSDLVNVVSSYLNEYNSYSN